MPGQQAERAVRGDRYETFAESLLLQFSNPVHVPRQRDYGIDFYCSLRVPNGAHVHTTRDLFALQVGGPGKAIVYGGMREEKPRPYEIEWLRSLTVPLVHGRVDARLTTLEIFSMAPVWRVLSRSPMAFRIDCTLSGVATTPTKVLPERCEPAEGVSFGDGLVWTVDLGPPVVEVTMESLQNPAFLSQVVECLRAFVGLDWITITRLQTRVALPEFILEWRTNSLDGAVGGQAMYWSSIGGANLRELAVALTPALLNLGANLQWQDDPAAYRLIDLLEWVHQQAPLPQMGSGLLDGLRGTRDAGLTPGAGIKKP